jgi:hypothetical protein
MKTQEKGPKGGGGRCGLRSSTADLPDWPLTLDTYKQFAQPNRHAGSSLFWGLPFTLNLKDFLCPEKATFQDFHSPERQRVHSPSLLAFLRLLDGRFSAMVGVTR